MYRFRIKDEPFAVGYLSAESESKYVRTGAGYMEAVKAVSIRFDKETGFPVLDFGDMACNSSWSSGQSPNIGLLHRKAEQFPDLSEDYLYIAQQMKELELGCHWSEFTENEWDITVTNSGWGGTWGGHAVPELCDFARLGTDGIRDKIKIFSENNLEKQDFYKGLYLTLDAIDLLGERVLTKARSLYATAENEKEKKKLKRIINTFGKCPKSPADTFDEAVCVYVLIFLLDGVDSPGHFDQYMYPFWERSDPIASREALEDLWIFFHQTRTWNLCISGSDEKWKDLTNPLTYEILDVARKYRFQTPNLTMRCHRNTPEKLYRAAAETIATGIGMPALYNDEAVCPALESIGILPEHSHLYVMNGCNQIDIQGKSHMGLEDGEVNLGMALEYVLSNGINRKTGKLVGKRTGEPQDLLSFEDFFDALKEQVMFLCDGVCSMANKAQRIYAQYTANPIRSMTIEGCIEKGLDYKCSGPLYGHGQILWEGIADAADSLANIKRYVYDEKKYTLAKVATAMAANYEGYEEMHRTFCNSGLNFGNDIPYVDELCASLVNFANSYLRTKRTYRGGVYTGGCSPFNRAADNGMAVGALPNGKRAGEAMFADSIGATPGNDTNGPTALLSSCLKYDHTLAGSGFILNLKFTKEIFSDEKGIESFIALWRGYFSEGGQQLSVTVVSAEELIEAMNEPHKHKNLIVRVGGYSDYFVNLPVPLQENIVARTRYSL
ncbi:MAG: hypothetical protein E7575_03125 [Ruminococcaceae bacterium]|nr:hypothetical protein [Oscillospiraceae bacterium]